MTTAEQLKTLFEKLAALEAQLNGEGGPHQQPEDQDLLQDRSLLRQSEMII